MAIITSGKTFANGEQLSADKLNQVITAATFNASDAVDGSTMTLIGGAMAVADEGIATGKIAPGAVNFSKLTDVLDENDMSSDSATSLATQQSIKAYVTAMRPKFVSLTGGTTALIKENQANGTTVTYNIADFTSGDSDFATSKITGLIVEGFVFTKTNTNLILASLPDGTSTVICRGYTNDGTVAISDAGSTLIPINSDTSTFSFQYTVGNTSGGVFNQSKIRGAIIHPGL